MPRWPRPNQVYKCFFKLLLRERGEKPRSAGMQGEHWSALVFSLIGDPEVTVPRWKAQDIALGKRLAPLSE